MRESLGRAVNASDLQGCSWRSTSLDKIHALGLAKGLPEMIHFLDGLQPKSYKALTYEAADQARAHFMGMDIAQYQNGWNNRLQTVLRVLNDRYKIATQTAKDRLYD